MSQPTVEELRFVRVALFRHKEKNPERVEHHNTLAFPYPGFFPERFWLFVEYCDNLMLSTREDEKLHVTVACSSLAWNLAIATDI